MHSIAVGGLAPHVSELSAALARRGHEVHVFTRIGAGQSGYESIDGVHYHRCPFATHEDFGIYAQRMCDSFVWHIAETEALLGRPFDLVHGHDWLAVPALTQLKNRHGHRIVFTIHSTEYGRCGNTFRDDPWSRHVSHLEWEGTYVANRVICVSKTLARETQSCYQVPADKISTVYNGVDVEKFDNVVDRRAVRKHYGVGADDPMILFAGRLAWQKGPDILLDALPGLLPEFPDVKVVFAGDGDMRGGLEAKAEVVPRSSRPRFVGYLSGRPLVNLFKAADVVCVPSRNEPFGIVILEAWSAGRPVVATRIGGPAEFIEDYKTGLTVEPDVGDLRRGLRCLLGDRDGADWMGMNGRVEAERHFTWDHAAQATEAIYQTVAGIAPAKASRRTRRSTRVSETHPGPRHDLANAA
jgi:glycosyltransferase involved in cell wall biosynthesis